MHLNKRILERVVTCIYCTSIESAIGCSLQWTICKYVMHRSAGDIALVPTAACGCIQ